jgi:hypothetical protein
LLLPQDLIKVPPPLTFNFWISREFVETICIFDYFKRLGPTFIFFFFMFVSILPFLLSFLRILSFSYNLRCSTKLNSAPTPVMKPALDRFALSLHLLYLQSEVK